MSKKHCDGIISGHASSWTKSADSNACAYSLNSFAMLAVVCGSPHKQNAPVTEKGVSPRMDRLLNAEEEVLKVGGNVVRLAGLYISFFYVFFQSESVAVFRQVQ